MEGIEEGSKRRRIVWGLGAGGLGARGKMEEW